MLQAALGWAEQGWHVFPLCDGKKGDDRGKIPRIARAHDRGRSRCTGECGEDGHGAHDGTTVESRIRSWWDRWPNANIGANLGDDRIVFDIDVQHGGRVLEAFPTTRTHLTGGGGGNRHLVYRYTPGSLAAAIVPKNGALGPGMDIKTGRGAYVVLPPSLHESGRRYLVLKPERDEHLLSDDEVRAIYAEAGVALPALVDTGSIPVQRPSREDGGAARAGASGSRGVAGPAALAPAPTRSTLAGLLARPAATGGRNEWLTAVAGHYARDYRRGNRLDLFMMHVEQANRSLSPPLGAAEVDKICGSIWGTESERHPEREAEAGAGWLVSGGDHIQCQTMTKRGEEKVIGLDEWADFDLRAKQTIRDDLGHTLWVCELVQADPRTGLVVAREVTLPGQTLGDGRSLNKWLASYEASIVPPENIYPKRGGAGERLTRYLRSQCPPVIRQVACLGWDGDALGAGQGGFVTHEGVVTASGLVPAETAGVRADPRLASGGVAPYVYGFAGGPAEARRVLREVLTFHEQTACSVFGAWWAACLLKPQIEARTSLFPVAAIEAPSGSGKTNGFFDLMIRLGGNTRGETQLTRASLRQHLAAHHSGIVWVDDMDSLESIMELLRASTASGTISKMAEDRTSTVNMQMVAPMVLTGERLGLDDQKALRDRSIRLSVGSPVGRMSLHDPSRPQWDDVLALREQYPDRAGGLAQLSGWYVRWALASVDRVLAAMKEGKRVSVNSGRAADRDAALWAGACLLDAMVTEKSGREAAWRGEGEHAGRVRAWMQSDAGVEKDADNTLTREILPWVLRAFHYPRVPTSPGDRPAEMDPGALLRHLITPAFIHSDGSVWFSSDVVAEAWRLSHGRLGGRRGGETAGAQRTETAPALGQQATALGGQKKQVWFDRNRPNARRIRYWQLPSDYTNQVLGNTELSGPETERRNRDTTGGDQDALYGL